MAGSPTEGAVAALNAGCDLVLLCNQSIQGGRPLDDLLDGLMVAKGKGLWHPSPDSEARRVDLLPQTAPLTWDDLMFHPAYHQALSRLPQ